MGHISHNEVFWLMKTLLLVVVVLLLLLITFYALFSVLERIYCAHVACASE